MRYKFNAYLMGMDTLRTAADQDLSNVIILDGIIHRFEFQFERGIKMLKKMLQYDGIVAIDSPRDVLKQAYAVYDFIDENVWLDMLVDYIGTKNLPDYGDGQKNLVENILNRYLPAFETLYDVTVQRFPEEAKIDLAEMEERIKKRKSWQPPARN